MIDARIYLDMDGVLADLISGLCKRHKRPNPWVVDPNLPAEDLEAAWNMTHEEFWSVTDYDMWANLPKMPMADEIVKNAIEVFGVDHVHILTSPTYRCHGCVPGKARWVEVNYPHLYRRMIFAKEKRLLAAKYAALLDDFQRNVDAFKEHGGHGILCPAANNARRGEEFDIWKEMCNARLHTSDYIVRYLYD